MKRAPNAMAWAQYALTPRTQPKKPNNHPQQVRPAKGAPAVPAGTRK